MAKPKIDNYSDYLQSKHWKERRRKQLGLSPSCYACGCKGGLQVHHRTYARLGAERDDDLVTMCRDCHMDMHEKLEQGFMGERRKNAHRFYEYYKATGEYAPDFKAVKSRISRIEGRAKGKVSRARRDHILVYIARRNGEWVPFKELASKFRVVDPRDKKNFKQQIKGLAKKGLIQRGGNMVYRVPAED